MSSGPDLAAAVHQVEGVLATLQAQPTLSFDDARQAVERFRQVVGALAEVGPSVVPPLGELLLSPQPADFSRAGAAARLLAQLPWEETLNALLEALSSDNLIVMQRGGQALRTLPPSETHFRRLAEVFTAPAQGALEQFRQNLLADALARQRVPAFYPAAMQWLQTHPEAYVRRTLVEGLAAQGSVEALPLLRAALDDRDPAVSLRAAFGLLLEGERAPLDRLLNALDARQAATRAEGVTWLGLAPLPSVVTPVLECLTDRSSEVRLAACVRAHDLGVREALRALAALLDDGHTPVAEQAAAMLQRLAGIELAYQWQGRRLTAESVAAVRVQVEQLYAAWRPGARYQHGQLMTLTGLADALIHAQAQAAYWVLAGMTGQRLGFDPGLDLLVNWDAAQRWRAWATEHAHAYEPGGWYYRGQRQEPSN